MTLGKVVILNGPPRSGKSSLAHALLEMGDGVWMNLGVDGSNAALSPAARPGMGLRPGGERQDLEPLVVRLVIALYASVAAYSRQGINVAVDVGHHDDYSASLNTVELAKRELVGIDVTWVGVRCPIDEVMRRRDATNLPASREMVERWDRAVHENRQYDVEIDTSQTSPNMGASVILELL